MLKIVVITSIVAVALAAVYPVSSQVAVSEKSGRIVGGADANIQSYPWQVSLEKDGIHYCGGFIYSKYIIITAAHCTDDVTPDLIYVRAGTSTRNNGGVLIRVANFMRHEGFIGRQNDVAVLRLTKNLTYSSVIRPISLAAKEPPTGTPAVVTGWGQTYDGEPTRPLVLQYVNVDMIDTKLCGSDAYDYGDYIVPSMICAASPGKDACLDDSGGAIVAEGVAVGIVSYGIGCAEANHPGIYSNIAVLKDWIERNVQIV